jgi:hypothetical protein
MLRRTVAAVACLIVVGGCSSPPRTDEEVIARAQEAVDRKLSAQATFSLMESAVTRQIACGHASVAGAAGKPTLDQDFVYRDGNLIMETDANFDAAAVQCDAAVGDTTASEDNASTP